MRKARCSPTWSPKYCLQQPTTNRAGTHHTSHSSDGTRGSALLLDQSAACCDLPVLVLWQPSFCPVAARNSPQQTLPSIHCSQPERFSSTNQPEGCDGCQEAAPHPGLQLQLGCRVMLRVDSQQQARPARQKKTGSAAECGCCRHVNPFPMAPLVPNTPLQQADERPFTVHCRRAGAVALLLLQHCYQIRGSLRVPNISQLQVHP